MGNESYRKRKYIGLGQDPGKDREGMRRCFAVLAFAVPVFAQQHDLLLKGGRLIDPKNNIDARMDVAVRAGKGIRGGAEHRSFHGAADARRVRAVRDSWAHRPARARVPFAEREGRVGGR